MKFFRFGLLIIVAVSLFTLVGLNNTSFALTLSQAINQEIKGMTKLKPNEEYYFPEYGISKYNNAVKRFIKKWSKGWDRYDDMMKDASVYELLARTFYFESSQNNKSKKKRENEILAFDKVISNRMKHKDTQALYNGPTLYGVLSMDGQFYGLTRNDKSCKKISYDKKKMDLTLVRSVVLALAKKMGTTKIKYPDNKKYCYWHSIEDWRRYTNDDETKIKFGNKYYKIKMKKKYSDTVFYDYIRE